MWVSVNVVALDAPSATAGAHAPVANEKRRTVGLPSRPAIQETANSSAEAACTSTLPPPHPSRRTGALQLEPSDVAAYRSGDAVPDLASYWDHATTAFVPFTAARGPAALAG